jgi:hypothetical protein
MRLSNGFIDTRPQIERDGSGVSALVGLEGFVVRAQLLDEASGEWWLAVETSEERAWCPCCGAERCVTAAGGWWCGICRWRIGRWRWCGPSACGAVRSRRARH